MSSDIVFLLVTTLAQAAVALLLALVIGGFRRFYRHAYLADWAASWWALAASLALAAWSISQIDRLAPDVPARLVAGVLSLTAALLHLFWIAAGTVALTHTRPLVARRRWLLFLAFGAVAILLTLIGASDPPAAALRYVLRVGSRVLATAVVFLGGAVLLWGTRQRGRHGLTVLTAGFAGHGLVSLAYGIGTLLGPGRIAASRFALALDGLDAVTLVAIGLGMVVWVLEEEQERRREAVRDLAASESRHRRIVEGASAALWEEDLGDLVAHLRTVPASTPAECRAWLAGHPDFVRECISRIRVLGVNEAALRIYGAESERELLDNLPRLFLPESHGVFIDELVAFWEGRTTFDGEAMSQNLQGERRILLYSIRVPFPEEGFRYVLLSVVDVTALKAAERALRESEERYRTLFDNAPVGIGVANAEGRLLAVNDTMRALGGYERDDPLPLVGALYDDAGVRDKVLAELYRTGTVRQREVRFRRKDGSTWEANLSLALVTIDGAPCALAIVEDISQRKRLEEALRQAQKMEAVGQLTGGIAHDFNNFLTAIQVNAELAADLVTADPAEAVEALAAIRRTADRSAAMVRSMLAFSRREGLRLTPLPLGAVVEEVAAMLQRLLPESILIETAVPDALRSATVQGDRSAIEQILVNLATNARDAMPEGGTFTLTLSERTLTAPESVVGGHLPTGTWLCVEASDTGPGLAPALAERAFEPFFTTKPQGSGSGLGLAMVFGLVRQHGGGVRLQSDHGTGATFTLFFRRAAAQAPDHPEAGDAIQPGGGETILVVEDEAAIREATRRLLERSGYRVLTAADGAEALTVLTAAGPGVGLVLADVVMPTLGGPGLMEAARARGLDLPFVFMSGYTDRQVHADELDPAVPLLPKPWRAGDLLRLVRARLGEDRNAAR